jgi:integrase
MARKIKSPALDSRTARDRLAANGKPYYCVVEPGLHLGYRKPKGKRASGKWVIRIYDEGKRSYTIDTIATADDFSDADGVAVLDFWQATKLARERMVSRAHTAAGKGPHTVATAIERYLEALEAQGKDSTDTRARVKPVLQRLGKIDTADLTTDRLEALKKELASGAPRVRTAKGQPQRFRKMAEGKEGIRRRRNTANRVMAILNAALTHGFREGRIASDHTWRRIKLFENVTSARTRYLTVAEAQRLLNACAPDFRGIVRAALLTGCRYGELCRLKVADFNPDSDTLAIFISKSGKPRHVVVTEEGAAFFRQLCTGRTGDELLLPKANGLPWGPSHQIPLMVSACERAKIKPAINFHGLRHTYASLTTMAGAPLMVVAENLGHADTRMVQKFYGHLSRTFVADAIRAAAPRFGTDSDSNVRLLPRAGR